MIVEHLFKESGYETYPFGYESMFSRVTSLIENIKDCETAQRIRSSPDLLVISKDKKKIYLIEVKFKSFDKLDRIYFEKETIDGYDRYWQDAILVVVVPAGEYFYAQKISELMKTKNTDYAGKYYFNLYKRFKPIYTLFDDIKKEKVELLEKHVDSLKQERR